MQLYCTKSLLWYYLNPNAYFIYIYMVPGTWDFLDEPPHFPNPNGP